MTKKYTGPIAVSACLAGHCTKYNGGNNEDPRIKRMVEAGKVVVVCLETSGGLPIPRVPSEMTGGDGVDVLAGWEYRFRKVLLPDISRIHTLVCIFQLSHPGS